MMFLEFIALLGLFTATIALAIALSAIIVQAMRQTRAAARAVPAGGPATEILLPPAAEQAPPATEQAPAQVERRSTVDTLPLGFSRSKPIPPPASWPAADSIQVREVPANANTSEAQGFYKEIAELLSAQIEADPARLDLHRTLLEVYRAGGEADAYVRYARLYYERSPGPADPHWAGIARAGRELVPGHDLFSEEPGPQGPKKFQRFYETVSQVRLQEALRGLGASYETIRRDPTFLSDLLKALADGARRPTPLAPMPLSAEDRAGAAIFAKREDVRSPNDDQLINAMGQVLLAQRLGCRRLVTASRDGIHGLAAATVASRHDLECTVYMTEPVYRRHFARVLQMRRLGADVRTVPAAPDVDAAWQAALSAWLKDTAKSHYVSSLESGPHPFPLIVRDFQSIVGQEALLQMRAATGALPSAVVAGAADGYVGLGLLTAFLAEEQVPLYCVEPPETAEPGNGRRYLREHNWLRATHRVQYVTATDEEAMQVVEDLFRATGMCVPTESARTLAYARRLAVTQAPNCSVLTLIATPEEPVVASAGGTE